MKKMNKLITLLRPLLFFKKAFLNSTPSLSPQRGEGESASPGTVFRIRTRCRISEILLKLNSFFSGPNQAPDSGSDFKSPLITNSFLYRGFKTLIDAVAAGTERLLTPLSLMGRKVPRFGALLAGTLTASSLYFGTVKDAVADPGPGGYYDSVTVSVKDTLTGVVSDASAPYENSYWMNEKGEIWSGGDGDSGLIDGEKILGSLDSNDKWQYLAKGAVEGAQHFIMFNDTEDRVYIRNAISGAEWGSWTYTYHPDYFRGLDVDNQEILMYNGYDIPKRISRFSLTGTHLDNMLLPFPTVGVGNGIVSNPAGENIIMNGVSDDKFYVIWFTGTEYSSHETFSYSDGGTGGNAVINDVSFDVNNNLFLIGVDDPDLGHVDKIKWYRNIPTPTPTPTPEGYKTPTPTPETSKIGIFRSTSGLWALRYTSRIYFGGTGDEPVYRDYDGDGYKDIAIFRGSSGLWAIRNITRVYFGSSDDECVPGDYNGDGSCDLGIFRGSSGLWAVRGITRAYFGGIGDTPVPGDYDGNGSDGIGIYRETSGLWALRGVSRVYFGGVSDEPVQGDYTGNSTCDVGIFRGSSGLWAIRSVTRSYFGGSTDEPVPADYDDEGAEEIGIFRDTSGLWAIKSVTRIYFGGVGDIPVTR